MTMDDADAGQMPENETRNEVNANAKPEAAMMR